MKIGKSYILLRLSDVINARRTYANIVYVDKECLSFSDTKTDMYLYVKKMTRGYQLNHLFVDKVQSIQNFQLCFWSLLNENVCDIYCTGSNAR